MGTLPGIHETVTSIRSFAGVLTGNTEEIQKIWEIYGEESVICSGIRAGTS